MKWLAVLCLTGCASAPVVLTKTETVTVEVERLVPVPLALSADCPPKALEGSTVAAALARLASVEDALAQCRVQLAKIRGLPVK